jgi:hypothetical protein
MNPVPSMLTAERRDALARAVAPAFVKQLLSLYRHDPETAMWHLDRDSLDAGPDRKVLGAAVEAAGFEALRFTNPASRFQFFDLSLLSDVIDTALGAGLSVLHVAPQPLEAQTVVTALRGIPMQASGARVHLEDMRTRHAAVFGRTDGYIADEGQVLGQLRSFIAGQS